jgi:hypothetical protein
MEYRDPIIDGAFRDLGATDVQIDQAERMIKILAEAGEDVTVLRSSLSSLKARREKLLTSLKNNGARSNPEY